MGNTNVFTFFYPVIDSLNKGTLIRKIMSGLFNLVGILIFLYGLYFFLKI